MWEFSQPVSNLSSKLIFPRERLLLGLVVKRGAVSPFWMVFVLSLQYIKVRIATSGWGGMENLSVLQVLQRYLLGSAPAQCLSHQLEVGWFWSWEDHFNVFETFYKQHSGESHYLHQVHSTTAAQTQCMSWRDCNMVLLFQLLFHKVAHRKSVGWRVKRN